MTDRAIPVPALRLFAPYPLIRLPLSPLARSLSRRRGVYP